MGNTFFSHQKRSCYRKMLFKRVAEHHAKHHDVNERRAETSHKCVKAFSSEVSSAYNHQGRNTSLPDTQQDRIV